MADSKAQTSTPTTEEKEEAVEQQPDQRAKDKGKQTMVKPKSVGIMDLKPEDLNKPLDLIVYRKWTSRNVPVPSPTGICFILLDKKAKWVQNSHVTYAIGGTVNMNGCLLIKATHIRSKTGLSQIVDILEDAHVAKRHT
ncbi:Cation-transporting P-type ATPase [Artemisia annua]|uniref:Cation-transporting P-type ATPase n=1 Tax=Artemisia annua TaxID=35608 RepID=A0A2U1MGA8_ARTAN|nr:Cation-transporting P-type ATPase [Artemisia annua]